MIPLFVFLFVSIELEKLKPCIFSELHKQHRDKLEEITHRFENIKMGLSVSLH